MTDQQYLEYIRQYKKWAELQSVILVRGKRRISDQLSQQDRDYIPSLRSKASGCLEAVGGHWGIENCVHWVLDLAFREDESRVRRDHSPQNLAMLRRMATNLLKQERTVRAGTHAQRLKAAWDQGYLLKSLHAS